MRKESELRISKQLVYTGLLTWLTFAYILYAFLYMFRESFRILTALGPPAGYQPLLVMTDSQLFLYNLFYATLASAIGYMFSLRFVMNRIYRDQSRRAQFLIRNTLNDQGFITWSFLFWFGKLGGLLGICFLMIPLQYDFSFIIDSPLLLVLLPIVIFLGTWPSLRRIVRSNAIKWLGLSSIVFISMSFLFAMKNFINIDEVNHNLLKNNIDYAYSLDLPRGQSHEQVMKKSLITEVYVVLDSTGNPQIFFDNIHRPVDISGLDLQIRAEKDKLSIYEHDRWKPVLYIDSNIPMFYVKDLKYRLRKSEVHNVMYSTGMKFSKYPSNYPLLRLSGMSQYLGPKHYPEFESFLDSAETIDRDKYSIRLPESLMYRVNSLDTFNRIEVSLSKSDIKINGQTVTESKLNEVVYSFYRRFSPNAVIIYNVENNVSYGRYIEVLDILYWQIDKLRNELSWEVYDEPFDQWDWRGKKDTILFKYSRAIVEWTREETRLIELME